MNLAQFQARPGVDIDPDWYGLFYGLVIKSRHHMLARRGPDETTIYCDVLKKKHFVLFGLGIGNIDRYNVRFGGDRLVVDFYHDRLDLYGKIIRGDEELLTLCALL